MTAPVDPFTEKKLTLNQPIQYDAWGRGELVPTMRSHFLHFSYDLTVACYQSWCPRNAEVVSPIVLTTKGV